MKKNIAIVLVVIVAFILFLKRKTLAMYDILYSLFVRFEGFRAFPYWDVNRYSWGYGTAVPSKYLSNGKPLPGVQISRSQAFIDAFNHVNADKAFLSPKIKTDLTPGQWAALLCFSYNVGNGNGANLVANINAKNWSALGVQWNKYIYAGGKVNQDLVKRRQSEWQLFSKDIH